MVAMLQREVLLTEAKLHALDYELITSDRKLRQLRSQLRQVRGISTVNLSCDLKDGSSVCLDVIADA